MLRAWVACEMMRDMEASRELKPVGWNFWFALGAFLLGVALALAQVSLIPTILWIIALTWAGIGLWRAIKIHRYVTQRSKAP